jgi:hypothetical protein
MLLDPDKPSAVTVHTEVDVTELLANNRRLEEEQRTSKSPNKLIARVPMTVYEKSMLEDWDEEQWKRWLNDPDNAAFRVWRGKV